MKRLILLTAVLTASIAAFAQVQLGGHIYVPSTGDSSLGQTNVVFTADGNCNLTSPSGCTVLDTGGFGVDAPYLGTLKVTSNVALTAARTVTVPLSPGRTYNVENLTTGGQSITVGGTTGAAVTVPNGVTSAVVSDGTNYISVTGAGGGSTPTGQQYRIAAYTGSGSSSATQLGQSELSTDSTGNSLTGPGTLNLAASVSGNCLQSSSTGAVVASFTPCGSGFTGYVNILNYGLAGHGSDVVDTLAFNAAVDVSNATGRPLYIPTGNYYLNTTVHPVNVGIAGDGQNRTNIRALGDFAGAAVLDMCANTGGQDCTAIFVRGLDVVCPANRPSVRTAHSSDLGNTSTGIRIEPHTNNPTITDVGVSGCFYDVDWINQGGSGGIDKSVLNSGWYGLYYESAAGDFKLTDTALIGNLMASIGMPGGPTSTSLYNGGMNGFEVRGTHMGFSPYGIYQENGAGNIGIFGATFIGSPFEQIGNECIRMPLVTGGADNRYTSNVTMIHEGCDFTDNPQYSIAGDANNPVHDYAWNLIDHLADDGSPAGVVFIGGEFPAGTSGYSLLVNEIDDIHSPLTGVSPQNYNVLFNKQNITPVITSSSPACLSYYLDANTITGACGMAAKPGIVSLNANSDGSYAELQAGTSNNNLVAIGTNSGGYSAGQIGQGESYVRTVGQSSGTLNLVGSDQLRLLTGGLNGGSIRHGLVIVPGLGLPTDPWHLIAGTTLDSKAICTADGTNCPSAAQIATGSVTLNSNGLAQITLSGTYNTAPYPVCSDATPTLAAGVTPVIPRCYASLSGSTATINFVGTNGDVLNYQVPATN